MTDREKLVEIIEAADYKCDCLDCDGDPGCEYRGYHNCQTQLEAHHLIANGVIFATDNNVGNKWISVKERLPEKEGTYIVFTLSGCVTTARFYPERDFCNYRGEFIRHEPGRFHRNATHWMPLPEAPKEEDDG